MQKFNNFQFCKIYDHLLEGFVKLNWNIQIPDKGGRVFWKNRKCVRETYIIITNEIFEERAAWIRWGHSSVIRYFCK